MNYEVLTIPRAPSSLPQNVHRSNKVPRLSPQALLSRLQFLQVRQKTSKKEKNNKCFMLQKSLMNLKKENFKT